MLNILTLLLAFSPFLVAANDSPQPSAALAKTLAARDFREIRRITLETFKRYPPEDYIYVGVGRSPVSLTAFMRAVLPKDSVINLPLSEMKFFGRFDQVGSEDIQELRESQIASLQPHFRHFLPADPRKKILLIDFTSTGKGLVNTWTEVSRFYQGKDVEVKALGLFHFRRYGMMPTLQNNGVDLIRIESDAYGLSFLAKEYGPFAEFKRAFAFPLNPEHYQANESRGDAFAILVREFELLLAKDAVRFKDHFNCESYLTELKEKI